MGFEHLGKGTKIEIPSPVIEDRTRFGDSERNEGMELPMGEIGDNIDEVCEDTFSDSERESSEVPKWDQDNIEFESLDQQESMENCDIKDTDNAESYSAENDNSEKKNNSPENNEDGTRELTDDERQTLKDKLGWSDDKLKKCTIDENGVIHYKTDRCDLEGKTSENGVAYERRTIEINGVKIEGVFPKFESVFNTELSPDNYQSKAYATECNAKLKEAIQNDPELRSKFTPEQIKDIEDGSTPTGYVWHHNEEPGKMQLVKREDHDRAIGGAAHTGGNSLWGADSVDNSKKGESF